MIDVMYVECLIECLETITSLTNYEYYYYNYFYAWFKGSGPEILVSCVFWYYNSTESCLRPRERCDNDTMGKNWKSEFMRWGEHKAAQGHNPQNRLMGHLKMKSIGTHWTCPPMARATDLTCCIWNRENVMHGLRWLLHQHHFKDPEEKGRKMVEDSVLLRVEFERWCVNTSLKTLTTLRRNFRKLGEKAMNYYLFIVLCFFPPCTSSPTCQTGVM